MSYNFPNNNNSDMNDSFDFCLNKDHLLYSDDEGDFMMVPGQDFGFEFTDPLTPQHPPHTHHPTPIFPFSGSPVLAPGPQIFIGEEIPQTDAYLREPSPVHHRTSPNASPRGNRQHHHNPFPFGDFLSSDEFPSPSFGAPDPFGLAPAKPEPTPSDIDGQNICPNNNTAVRATSRNQPSCFSPPAMSATSDGQSTSPYLNRISLADHWTDTSPIRTEQGDRMDGMCDADKYLHNGLEDIDHALQFHFAGRQFPRHVSKRAKELFKRSYELQSQQKDGDVAFHKNRTQGASRRKRFARRKAFVVTAIVVALKEFGLSLNGRTRQSDSQAITSLSDTVPGGSKIRLTSVKSCCRSLSLTDIRFR